MSWLRLPWLQTLGLYAVLLVSFLLYGRNYFYRDPGSMFYDEANAFERYYSAYRETEVRNYIGHAERSNLAQALRAGARPSLYVGFASVKREGEQYLPLSVASIVYPLSECERKDIFVDILVAHMNTSNHPSWQTSWLHAVTDRFGNYRNFSTEEHERITRLEEEKRYKPKGVFDYVYLLQSCLDSGIPYCLLLEDDVILADGWLSHTLNGLANIRDEETRVHEREWLFMRLFNQERSTGWGSRKLGKNNELVLGLEICVPVLLVLAWARRRYAAVRQRVDLMSIAIISFILIPTFIILFFQAGKASMLPPKDGVFRQGFGCCSQGLVFPRNYVPRIIEFLTERKAGQIDLLLNDLAEGDRLDRWALYPVQMQHVGTRSARGTAKKEAQAVWSMQFEYQDPSKVARKHQVLAQSIYGNECSTRIAYLPKAESKRLL